MRKEIKNIFKGGLAFVIGGQTIDLPFNPLFFNMESLSVRTQSIIQIFLIFSSVVAVAMIIVSAYTLITAAGDPDKIEQGQKTLTASIIGLVIVWLAALVVGFILKGVGYS